MGLSRWLRRRVRSVVEELGLRARGLRRTVGERQYPRRPGTLKGLDPDHLFRYEWAKQSCEGKSVLDYGCGVGYGSYVLSSAANRVTGYDVSPDALDWARHYSHKARNLTFSNSLPRSRFDVVTCFECIEHVDNPEAVLAQLAGMFNDWLLISTPTPKPDGSKWSDHHVREFTKEEFLNILEEHVRVDETFDQWTNGCRVVLAKCAPKKEQLDRVSDELLRSDYWRACMYADLSKVLSELNISGEGVEFGGSNGVIQSFCPNVKWTDMPYPPYDVCDPASWNREWDVVVLDQILEHTKEPWTALENIGRHAKVAIITVPFLLSIHKCPGDYWRMTPDALRAMAEPHFKSIYIKSWGNPVVSAWYTKYNLTSNMMAGESEEAWRRELTRNDPNNPVVIWAVLS